MDFFDWLGASMDIGQIVSWLAVAMTGGGITWVAIKRWFLPKEVVELKERLDEHEAELKVLKNGATKRMYDEGYKVLSWWGETGNALADSARHLFNKQYPKTIFIRKTGEVRELPYPPEANKIPTNG